MRPGFESSDRPDQWHPPAAERIEHAEHARERLPRYDAGGNSLPSIEHPTQNQDAILIDSAKRLYGVFDGVGGNNGGERASAIARDIIYQGLQQLPETMNSQEISSAFERIFSEAHQAIVDEAMKNPAFSQMATTASLVKMHRNESGQEMAFVSRVGDTPVYVLQRDGTLKGVGLDDNMVTGKYSRAESADIQKTLANVKSQRDFDALRNEEKILFNQRNVILAALGTSYVFRAYDIPLQPGDRVIIVSDGVSDNLTWPEMQSHATGTDKSAQRAADELVAAAYRSSQDPDPVHNIRAKHDDMSAIVIAVPEQLGRIERILAAGAPASVRRSNGETERDWKVRSTLVTVVHPNPAGNSSIKKEMPVEEYRAFNPQDSSLLPESAAVVRRSNGIVESGWVVRSTDVTVEKEDPNGGRNLVKVIPIAEFLDLNR